MLDEREGVNTVAFSVYEAVFIVAAAFAVRLAGAAPKGLLFSESVFVLGVLLASAIALEALPFHWSVSQQTTLAPMVLLLALLLTPHPILAVAVAGLGAFLGYGTLYAFRRYFRQATWWWWLLKMLFYTTQYIVVVSIVSRLHWQYSAWAYARLIGWLYSFVPGITLQSLQFLVIQFTLNVLIAFGAVVLQVLLSMSLLSVYNRLVSSLRPSDIPLPIPNLLVFLVTAIAPVITVLFYQILSEGTSFWVNRFGTEGVRRLALFVFWPLIMLVFYGITRYFAINIEAEEDKKERDWFVHYSERMLDMAGVTELVVQEMQAAFGCDDCIVYSWNVKRVTYELEGGQFRGEQRLRESADKSPDIGWPVEVKPDEGGLGKAAESPTATFWKRREVQRFFSEASVLCPACTSMLIIPLREGRADQMDLTKIGLLVLLKRGGAFTYDDRFRANRRLSRRTALHVGLLQARRYRDVRHIFVRTYSGVARSGEILAATQALFVRGVDPARFISEVTQQVRARSLIQVVEGIAKGEPFDTKDGFLSDEWISDLYLRIGQEDRSLNLPALTPDIIRYLRTLISSLSTSFASLNQWPAPDPSEITPQMQKLYSIFLSALRANTVEEIIAFEGSLEAREDLDELAKRFGEPVHALRGLRGVVEELKLALDSDRGVDVIAGRLGAVGRTLEPQVRQEPRSPEQVVVLQIQSRWASVIHNKRQELLGPSVIRMRLETQETNATAGEIVVDLCVENGGWSLARDIHITFSESEEYVILDSVEASVFLDRLEPGHSRRLSFRIRPTREGFVRIAYEARWSDRLSAARSVRGAGRVTLRPESFVFVPIANPYTPGPPLRPGNPLFLGREDVFDFVQNSIGAKGQHNVLVLIGQRRTGKTSLALHLLHELDHDRYVVVYVDCQALGTEQGTRAFFSDLSWEICSEMEDQGIESVPPALDDQGQSAGEGFVRSFLPVALEAIGNRSLVLVMDEFEELQNRVNEGKVDTEVFQFLRHLMQHVPNLAFIFVGTHRLKELSQDYWSIFFGMALQKEIGFLDESSARRLIAESTEQAVFDDLAVEQILQLTAGHPYLVQLFCHYMVDYRNRAHVQYISAQNVRDAVPGMLEQAEGHLAHLWRIATADEQMILASAARLLTNQSSVQVADMVAQLVNYGIEQTPYKVLEIAESLVARDILECSDRQALRYRFKVELVRRWIEHNQPLSMVVGSLT